MNAVEHFFYIRISNTIFYFASRFEHTNLFDIPKSNILFLPYHQRRKIERRYLLKIIHDCKELLALSFFAAEI